MYNIEKIETMIKKRQYDDALNACQVLIESNPEVKYKVFKLKSHIFASQGLYEDAVNEGLQIINDGKGDIACYDSTAFWALFDDQLDRALELYLTALEMGYDTNETWFRSNELFLIAYIYCRIGGFTLAKSYLDQLNEKDKKESFLIPFPEGKVLMSCSVEQLYNKITADEQKWSR